MFCFMYVLLLMHVACINAVRNIILILTDDLDVVLDGMTPLSYTNNLIGSKGAIFQNSFVASPICCPNRASILTGRYVHNHLVFNNSVNGGCNSRNWQNNLEKNTFANYLKKDMNYKTFYAGKYLNQYGSEEVRGAFHIPPGWDWWVGLVGNSKYYDYSLSINGTAKAYGRKPNDYLTDVIKKFAANFIKLQSKDSPFLMVLAPPAPHAPFIEAPRHHNKYQNVTAKRTKTFNKLLNKDKHWLIKRGPIPLSNNIVAELDTIYRKRWETLLAVDELVLEIYQLLQRKNILDDTYIIFTSDNGYHIGQFSLTIDKRQPYETDIRVPLLIRGPGITPSQITAPVSSVDIFATILDIAGLQYPSDGTSLLWNLPKNRTLLIEYRGEKSNVKQQTGCPSDNDLNLSHCDKELACKCQDVANNTFSCIRRISKCCNDIFCTFEDNEQYLEAYDLSNDIDQIYNIGYTMKHSKRYRFRKRLKKMIKCKNENCIYSAPRKRI